MRVNDYQDRVTACGTCEQPSVDAELPKAAGSSFQVALSNCAEARPQLGSWAELASRARRVKNALHNVCSDTLARAWAFLHAKYKISTTKRLRVSETISLGEKRFIAILSVEGREFLIGGGVSGVSLLARLGSAAGGDHDLGATMSDGEDAL